MRQSSTIIGLVVVLSSLIYIGSKGKTKKKDDCYVNLSLLSDYQQTMSILQQTDTATANKFSRVMEQINTGVYEGE